MKKYLTIIFASFLLMSCSSNEEKLVEILMDSVDKLKDADNKDAVKEIGEESAEDIKDFWEDLSPEEQRILDESVHVNSARSTYSLHLHSKSIEYGLE